MRTYKVGLDRHCNGKRHDNDVTVTAYNGQHAILLALSNTTGIALDRIHDLEVEHGYQLGEVLYTIEYVREI